MDLLAVRLVLYFQVLVCFFNIRLKHLLCMHWIFSHESPMIHLPTVYVLHCNTYNYNVCHVMDGVTNNRFAENIYFSCFVHTYSMHGGSYKPEAEMRTWLVHSQGILFCRTESVVDAPDETTTTVVISCVLR
jgi:hypothetical protein